MQFAPAARRAETAPRNPNRAACKSAVSPNISGKSTVAPASSNTRTISSVRASKASRMSRMLMDVGSVERESERELMCART